MLPVLSLVTSGLAVAKKEITKKIILARNRLENRKTKLF